jgi:hypothetical protein
VEDSWRMFISLSAQEDVFIKRTENTFILKQMIKYSHRAAVCQRTFAFFVDSEEYKTLVNCLIESGEMIRMNGIQ